MGNKLFFRKTVYTKSLRYMFDWLIIAITAAAIGVVVIYSFSYAISEIQIIT